MAEQDIDTYEELPDDNARESDSRKRRSLAVLAIIALIIVALWLIWTQLAVVPDVSGVTEAEARATLTGAGFNVGVRGAPTGDSSSAVVVSQSHPAGEWALKGTQVMLTFGAGGSGGDTEESASGAQAGSPIGWDAESSISSASDTPDDEEPYVPVSPVPDKPKIPMVGNMPKAEAISALEGAGYIVAIGGYGPTTSVGEGCVYHQEPPFGSGANRGTKVTIWISDGAPHEHGYEGVPYSAPE